MAVRSCILYCALRFSFQFFHQLHFPLFGTVYPSFFLRVYLKSRKYGLFLQTQREFALKSLGQYRIILSADTASEVRQLPERCLSRKAGIVRCCLRLYSVNTGVHGAVPAEYFSTVLGSAILLTQKHSAACFTRKHWLGQYRIILSADTASEVRQPPERCLSR